VRPRARGRGAGDQERPDAVVITGRPGFFSAGVDLDVAPNLDEAGQRAMVTGANRQSVPARRWSRAALPTS
jgi:hypothetical protein